jgi:uncharacterized protein (DUF433 family)
VFLIVSLLADKSFSVLDSEEAARGDDRIIVHPQQCGDRPFVRGMRIRVTDGLDLLAAGLSPAEVVVELPDLEPDDITACLRFASAQLSRPGAAA